MREILFRAWDKRMKKWIAKDYAVLGETTLFRIVEQHLSENNFGLTTLERLIDVEESQYTGLKDKSGTPIYEGDILEIVTDAGRKERFTVKWGIHRRDMRSGFTVDIPGFSFVSPEGFPTFPIVNNYLNGHDLDIIEVVGNIYES